MISTLRVHRISLGALFLVSTVFVFGIGSYHAHAAAISSSLDLGSTGQDVTSLQTYLATDARLYPSALITGYYGPLTAAAVKAFQSAQGIVTSGTPATTGYGRVGPSTMARLNSLMGGVSVNPWATVPVLTMPSVQSTNTTATFSFTTNEPTQGQVYWGTSPITADEATGPGQTPNVSGTLALDSGGLMTSHTVTVSNLQSNMKYYYLIRVIDSGGRITITWPPGSLQTAQ